MAYYTLSQIRDALVHAFNESELKVFCFDHFDEAIQDIAQASALSEKAMNLVLWCKYRDRLDELVEKIKQVRPHVFEPVTGKKDTLPRRAQFFGRAVEIEKVLRALNPNDRSWGIVLDGIGGIGKTALAVECSHRTLNAGLFASAVFVSAKTNQLLSGKIKQLQPVARTLEEFVDEAARALGREAIAKESGPAKTRALLAALRGSRTLLIFDNLETLGKEESEAMTDWLRELPEGCKALLTSRRRGGEGAAWLRLDKLDDDAAHQMIQAELGKDADLATKFKRAGLARWQALIDEASGSPLALTSVLGLLRKRASLSVEGAIDLLRHKDADDDLLRFVFQEARKDFTDNDVKALRALSFFVPSTSFEAWAETADLTRAALDNTIDRLNMLSLLNVSAGAERYALQTLTRAFAQSELLREDEVRQQAALRFARYWVDYAKRYKGPDKDSNLTYAQLDIEWDNLNATATLLWEMAVNDSAMANALIAQEKTANIAIANRSACRLLIDLGWALRQFLWFGGRWEERIRLSKQHYAVALALGDMSNTGWGARDAAWIYYSRGETDAAQRWTERAAAAWTRGGNKREQASGERLLGLIARQRKDYSTAQQHFEAALATYINFGAKTDEGIILNSLGELARERRYYKIAERHYRAALEIAQKEENFENLADRRGNLGELALVRKNYTGARMWLEQALPLAQTVGRQDLIGTHKYWLA